MPDGAASTECKLVVRCINIAVHSTARTVYSCTCSGVDDLRLTAYTNHYSDGSFGCISRTAIIMNVVSLLYASFNLVHAFTRGAKAGAVVASRSNFSLPLLLL